MQIIAGAAAFLKNLISYQNYCLGLISVGDEVVAVNNINVEGKTPNDVLKILKVKYLEYPKYFITRPFNLTY